MIVICNGLAEISQDWASSPFRYCSGTFSQVWKVNELSPRGPYFSTSPRHNHSVKGLIQTEPDQIRWVRESKPEGSSMPHWVKTVKLPPGVGVLAAGVVAVVVVAAAVVVELFEQEVATKAAPKPLPSLKLIPTTRIFFSLVFTPFYFLINGTLKRFFSLTSCSPSNCQIFSI